MLILLLLILCNVLLAVLFKYFDKYGVDNLNAIIINYGICVLVGSILVGHFIIPQDLISKAWLPYSILLSLFFITGFNIMALAFQKSGIALTAIISKLSLIISAVFAIVMYGEPLGIYKGIGIVMAIVAIVLVNYPSSKQKDNLKINSQVLILPLIVFVMSGIIEIILYYVQAENLVTDDSLTFVATSFGIACFIGIFVSIYRAIANGVYPGKKEWIGGIVLGMPNFMTIYLLLYLLGEGWDGSVLFPVNSIAVLLFTSLVGIMFYKEEMNRNKMIGILLSSIAIFLISGY